jgi:hypothetical protein
MAWRQTKTRAERGYGPEHDRLRAAWAPYVEAGTVACWRCHTLIHPAEDWQLGHDDYDRSIYRGPEHALCNQRAGARAGGLARARQGWRRRHPPLTTSRRW